jgi:CheY-like chemotaxis protein
MRTVKVLLVEDNAADVDLVREALNAVELAHVLEIASDFEGAKGHFTRGSSEGPCPDLLLMDLHLLQGSGLSLLRLVRENPEWRSVPVIVVSSSDAPRDREQAAELGAVDYFRKPTDLDEFMQLGPIVVKWLERESPHAE